MFCFKWPYRDVLNNTSIRHGIFINYQTVCYLIFFPLNFFTCCMHIYVYMYANTRHLFFVNMFIKIRVPSNYTAYYNNVIPIIFSLHNERDQWLALTKNGNHAIL